MRPITPALALALFLSGLVPASAEVKIAEAIETWGGADVILVGKLVKAQAGPVGLSNPPVYSHRLSLEVERVVRGRLDGEAELVTLSHSARQQREPKFPVGERCVVGAEKTQRGLAARRVVKADGETLAAVEQVSSIPLGWGVDAGRLTSPWSQIKGAKWAGPEPVEILRCAATGRPALLAGSAVTLSVVPKDPPKEIKWTNPDGDGIYIVTVANPTDEPITVGALLGKGGEVAWEESLAMRVQSKSYAIPGAKGTGEGLMPVTIKPGESVSGEINALTLEGPVWPRGGYRITFQFCLGELAASHSFYYMSRHHDAIRKAAIKALDK